MRITVFGTGYVGLVQGAVLADQQGSYVLTVAADDTAEIRRVQLGAAVGATVAVTSGLAEGDRVIVSDTSEWDAHDRVRLE